MKRRLDTLQQRLHHGPYRGEFPAVGRVGHHIRGQRVDDPAGCTDTQFVARAGAAVAYDRAVVGGHHIATVRGGAHRADWDAEEAEYAGDHVGCLVVRKDSEWSELGVGGGYLAGGDCAKEVDEEEVPLGRVGDLGPEGEHQGDIALDEVFFWGGFFGGELEG